MPTLSWNEIKKRALEFSQEWQDEQRENAETQSFYNHFFNVFGISRRRMAAFEAPVKKLGTKRGRIDLFWKGMLLVEQKSTGKDLSSAYAQALDYFPNLSEAELPKYVLVCDFQQFELYDLETGKESRFPLKDLHKHVELFGFMAGYQKREFKDQDPVNIKASEMMGLLHDQLHDIGYSGHQLELLLVRLLFCLFADDTGIFERDTFLEYIETCTKEDGSDVGMHIGQIFQVMNTPKEKRHRTLDETVNQFPYVNGSLFEETIPLASFDSAMRQALIKASYFDWSRISPAIFGSLFQSVMDKQKRRGIGAHYTTEQNIMKIVKPLFLDALHEEFNKCKGNKNKLQAFHDKLAGLTFLDPACGCGNFLILAYRELRLLEIEVLKLLYKDGQRVLDVKELSKVDVDAFYGIEYEEFPARIAEVALWLSDHQMNMRLSEAFGVYYVRLPLHKSPHIIHGNALRLDWKDIIPPSKLSYILGNPPFVGKHLMSEEQGKDMDAVCRNIHGAGVLDYVTAWYIKAAQYIQGTRIVCAFVSTNSIAQGEQVGILWNELFNRYHIKIHFAHRTFAWGSEARGKAAVHCVIIGFAAFDIPNKLLYDYESVKSEAHETKVANISPYLIAGDDLVILKRSRPLGNIPQMNKGSQPTDDGKLLFTDTEYRDFISTEPEAEKCFRPLLSTKEFLNGQNRWCLWLKDITPNEMKRMPLVMERLEAVRNFRLASKKAATRKFAEYPALFTEDRQPDTSFILIPRHSSENRKYVPFGFFDKNYIVSDGCIYLPDATLYHFGVLTSLMHMDWMRYVCGRLKSDFRYSNTLVYNNFPWPEEAPPAQKKSIEEKAQAVLDARAEFPTSSLADLYDPLTMPPVLLKAHQALDKAVDTAYRKQPFTSERERIEYLFSLYQKLTDPLLSVGKGKKHRKKRDVINLPQDT